MDYLGIDTRWVAIGSVADHCWKCRQATTQTIREQRPYFHFFHIRIFDCVPKYQQFNRKCMQCGSRVGAKMGDYRMVCTNPKTPWDELKAMTNPGLKEGIEGELQALGLSTDSITEDDIRSATISRELLVYYPDIRKRTRQTYIDVLSGFWLLTSLTLVMLGIWFSIDKDDARIVCFYSSLACFVTACWFLHTSVRRHVRKKYARILMPILHSISPTLQELETCRKNKRQLKLVIDAFGKHWLAS